MLSKTLRIILDLIASAVVFLITLIASAAIAGAIFGQTEDGYGKYSGGVLLAIVFIVTIVFAIWFNKFLERKSNAERNDYKNTKTR